MNDPRRSTYLDAIGIDRYVSRHQLPGAAVSARLATPAPDRFIPKPVEPTPPGIVSPQSRPVGPVAVKGSVEAPATQADVAGQAKKQPAPTSSETMPRFSLITLVAGEWLWVEELQGIPLSREQVRLVQAMANALQRAAKGASGDVSMPKPDVAQFDWPMHNNQQLDLGVGAAAAALASFLGRRLERGGLGLVLMGEAAAERVPVQELGCERVILRHSSADMLADPTLKKQAWTDLKSFLGRG